MAVASPVMAQGSDPAADNGVGVDVIVITARRQSETLQDAAIAVDAVSGDDLAQAGILDSQDLTRAVPALAIANGGGSNTSIIIRGVGNIVNNPYLDAAVTPSYDGVVLGRGSGAFGAAFYDLARVEVLKGPQGILYGRNATGGAINIIPERPDIGDTAAGYRIGVGNYEAFTTEGYVNLGVSDNSALRLSGTWQSHTGYNADGSDDLERYGLRGQFLIEPTDTLSVRLAADYTDIGGFGPGGSYSGFLSGTTLTPVPSNLGASEGLNTPAANAYRMTQLGSPGFGFLDALNDEQVVDAQFWGANAEITLETGLGTFTVIPAYRVTDSYARYYGPAFSTALSDENDKQLSFEARLAGSAGMIDYIVGGFYFDEDVSFTGEFNQEFVLPMQNYVSGTESLAAFGQLTANVTDKLRLTGGLRYTHDEKFIDGSIVNYIAFCGPPVQPRPECRVEGAQPHYPNFTDPREPFDWLIANGFIAADSVYNPTAPVQMYPNLKLPGSNIQKVVSAPNDSGSYSKLTWRAGVEFDVTPDSLLYATVETGYRAGGFQLASDDTTYDPETIMAYSIGSKNRFLDDRLQVNLEAFWWKYRDQQITYFTIDPATSNLVSSTQNVGSSEIRGFDADVIFRPMRNTTLSGQVQYLDTEYQDLHLLTAPPRNNYNCPVTNTGEVTNTNAPILDFDCSGRPLIFSPEWSINLGVEQVFPIDEVDLIVNLDTSWRSEQYTQFNFLDFQLVPSYWSSNASVTLAHSDDGWSASLYVNNIEDDRQVSFAQASPIGFAVTRYNAPRTYGLRVSGDF